MKTELKAELSTFAKCCAGFIGVCLLLLSLGSALIPPHCLPLVQSRFESRSNGVWTAIYDRIPNEAMILALALAGLAFILFALNGLRLKTISFPGGEISTVDKSAAEEGATAVQRAALNPDITITTKSPQPKEPPLFTIKRGSETCEVYGVLQLPWQLWHVVFLRWPNNYLAPASLRRFAAAVRQGGVENPAWVIIFYGLPPLVISYAGEKDSSTKTNAGN